MARQHPADYKNLHHHKTITNAAVNRRIRLHKIIDSQLDTLFNIGEVMKLTRGLHLDYELAVPLLRFRVCIFVAS